MGVHDVTIGDLFARNARLHGARTALVCGDVRLSFAELDRWTGSIAAALGSLGVGRGDRVAVLAQNCHWSFGVYGGAAKVGAITVPLNWRLAVDELATIVDDAAASVVIVDASFADAAKTLSARGARVVALRRGAAGAPGLEDLVERSSPLAAADTVESDDVFALIYTAAVDGRPRGAMLTHANVLAANLQVIAPLHLTTADVYLHVLPLFHVTDLGLALAALHAGGGNVILPRFEPALVLDAIARERATIIGEFAPMLARLLEEQRRAPRDVSSLAHLLGLDRPDTIRDGEQLFGATFWVPFGQTETTGVVTLAPFSERPGSSGREGLMAPVRIVDESGRLCRPREVGEVVARGPMIFQGYWRQPDVNAYTHRGGWHHTGDLAYLDEDGYLFYVERKGDKELIKPGGENVYPAEVERVILEHPSVKEVSVIGVPDPEWGEAVKAVCALREGTSATADEIIEHVRARIASYKKPKHVAFVAALPRSADGRVDRAEVKAAHGGARR